MKLGLKCSTDPKVTHRVWLCDNGYGTINIKCNNFYLATLTEKGILRISGISKTLGIATEEGKIKDIP